MKKAILLGIIGFLIFIVNDVSAQTSTKEYARNKMKEIIFKQTRNEGNFNFVLVPQPLEFFIAFAYPQWEEKRYTYKKMILEAKELGKEFKKGRKIFTTLFISFVKDWDSEGETSKKIPNDIAEYIFLENDKGKFVRCNKAEVPLMGSVINMINTSSAISLEFPSRFPDTNESVFAYTKIKFVVGGLGFKNNEFEYEVPFSNLFSDAPPEIKKIYYEIGIWEKMED